jgi:glycosyltransferase involved in cell wall biosynthesis
VPAYNEADSIGATVKSLLEQPTIEAVVVVDDGSRDLTAHRAGRAGAEVVSLLKNQGKGAALEAGFRATDAEFLLLVDADLGGGAGEVARLLPPLLGDEADLVIGRMPSLGGGGFGLVRSAARQGVIRLVGEAPSAVLSGQRAVSRHALADLLPLARGFGVEVGMVIDAFRLGFRVMEVPMDLLHRPTGRDPAGFLHRGRQLRDVLAAVWARRVSR